MSVQLYSKQFNQRLQDFSEKFYLKPGIEVQSSSFCITSIECSRNLQADVANTHFNGTLLWTLKVLYLIKILSNVIYGRI